MRTGRDWREKRIVAVCATAVVVVVGLVACAAADLSNERSSGRRLLGSDSDSENTPVLDWILARQSGEDTSTPVLDWFLDRGQDAAELFQTPFAQRVRNRIATAFFSELLRFNFTQSIDRINDAATRRASLELTTWNSTFARELFFETNGNIDAFGYDALDVDRFVSNDVCRLPMLRENLDVASMEDAFWQASPLSGELPRGTYTGCILGTGTYEAIARLYGIRRTFNIDSWMGKKFDELDPSSVTNLIKVNYGPLVESIFPRLRDPIELYPGRASVAESYFEAGTDAIVVDYGSFDHEFQYFRDEMRAIYPGVFLGRMYAVEGMSLFGGVLQVPTGAQPVYAVSFILVGDAQTTMPLSAP